MVFFKNRVAGVNPFNGVDFKGKLKLNKKCRIDFENFKIEKLPSNVQELLKKMLNKNPHFRISAEDSLNWIVANERDFIKYLFL